MIPGKRTSLPAARISSPGGGGFSRPAVQFNTDGLCGSAATNLQPRLRRLGRGIEGEGRLRQYAVAEMR
jgi:hypothetical protein